MNFEELKPKIIEELQKRAPRLKCPVCNHNRMTLVDGFFNRPIQKDLSGAFVLGGPSIPTVGIVCENCGNLLEFAVGVLGLLPPQDKKEDIK